MILSQLTKQKKVSMNIAFFENCLCFSLESGDESQGELSDRTFLFL